MDMIKRVLKKINKTLSPGKLYFGPENIILGVNNVCNLKCKMCDVGTQNLETNFAQNLVGSHPLNMPLDLFKKIIDQTATYYPKAKIGYAFTEPLIYPEVKESLVYAKVKGLVTSITTNALLLHKSANNIVEGGVKQLFVSLDGLEDTHNFTRGNKNSFQRAIDGIKLITSLEGAPEVSVFCVITEWNYKELKKFADYFADLPIKHLGFLHQNFITRQMADSHNALYGHLYQATHSNIEQTDFSRIDMNYLQDEIQNIKSTNYPFSPSFSPEIDNLEKLKIFYLKPEHKLGTTCNDVFTSMMIKTDGTVIPSHGRCYNVPMGNIYENTLKEIWDGSSYGDFRKDLLKAGGQFPACHRCCSAF